MPAFDIIASTVRAGLTVDEVEFEVAGAPPATAYMLGRNSERAQPVIIALHDERGDKATLLPDLHILAARGFLCLSIDSPLTRRAWIDRDQFEAFASQFRIAAGALHLVQGDADLVDHRVGLLGRGIGAEVAASLAAQTFAARVVVAIAPLPDRAGFLRDSPHPLAAGLRQFHSDAEMQRQIEGFTPHRLVSQLETSSGALWLLQVADDDDRLSPADHQTLAMSIPRTVRVEHLSFTNELSHTAATRSRVEFITTLCG